MSVQAVMSILRDRETKRMLGTLHAHAYGCAVGDATAFRHAEYKRDDDAEIRLRHMWGIAIEGGEISELCCYWFREAFENIAMGREDWRGVRVDDSQEMSVAEIYRAVMSRFPTPALLHANDIRDAFAKHMMVDDFDIAYDLLFIALAACFTDQTHTLVTPDKDTPHTIGVLTAQIQFAYELV